MNGHGCGSSSSLLLKEIEVDEQTEQNDKMSSRTMISS